jgi:signal peptidase I
LKSHLTGWTTILTEGAGKTEAVSSRLDRLLWVSKTPPGSRCCAPTYAGSGPFRSGAGFGYLPRASPGFAGRCRLAAKAARLDSGIDLCIFKRHIQIPLFNFRPSFLLHFIAAIINLTTPGAGLMLLGRWHIAYATQLSLFSLIILLCWFRLIFEPTFILGLLGFTGIIYLVGTVLCFIMQPPSHTNYLRSIIATCSFIIISWCACFAGFIYKDHWLGVHIYFVPSMSMHPTLTPGEFILLDSWIYRNHDPKLGDVVVFQQNNAKQWLVKRIARWPDGELQYNNNWFVLGDNRNASVDSRTFGGIASKQFVGQVKLVLLSIDQHYNFIENNFLKPVL